MKQKIKNILKRHPSIYHLALDIKAKFSINYLRIIIFGTKAFEDEWNARDLSSAENGYWVNRNLPSKDFLLKNIKTTLPESILEIGSNCGPNLYKLALKFPNANIVGIDINETAIQFGNKKFKEEGISNVKLFALKAEDHNQFSDKSFDVVFSWAVLMYIGPDKIREVMNEMIRLAKKELIVMERHEENKDKDQQGMGYIDHGNWKRNYISLIRQIIPDFPEDRVEVIKIPKEVWDPGGGGAYLVRFYME